MSRVGKQPIAIPSGVDVTVGQGQVSVKGPKGQLMERIPAEIGISVERGQVKFERPNDRKPTRALHGLARALVANMVKGVTEEFVRELEIQGVGYRAEAPGKKLVLSVGHSHPVELVVPKGVQVSVENNVNVKISGADRQQVGQFAADVRSVRPPEPYKGKGIRYRDEHVRRKVGKAGTAAGG
ncbi:MAG: 50S ribosomal protein L6 [Deltaproteobacteria bacterium]|nr:50S ribosomal protein L6 [Deltaproteobacteria bacterium]